MLKIRLQRIGRIHEPAFRVVVIEHTRAPKSGNFVERVGTYNAKTKQRSFKKERIMHWLSKGAQASPTVHNMLISAGIITGKKIHVLPKQALTRAQGASEAAKESAAESAAESATSMPSDTSAAVAHESADV